MFVVRTLLCSFCCSLINSVTYPMLVSPSRASRAFVPMCRCPNNVAIPTPSPAEAEEPDVGRRRSNAGTQNWSHHPCPNPNPLLSTATAATTIR
jgi:hypothetical protein